MARAAAKKKKKKPEPAFEFEKLMKTLWTEVDKAIERGPGFGLSEVEAEYKELALEARKKRKEEELPIKEVKPRKDIRAAVVRKSVEQASVLPLRVTPKAARAAIYLAEILETAEKPNDLNFKKWAKEGGR